jgi:hypothetical protein
LLSSGIGDTFCNVISEPLGGEEPFILHESCKDSGIVADGLQAVRGRVYVVYIDGKSPVMPKWCIFSEIVHALVDPRGIRTENKGGGGIP